MRSIVVAQGDFADLLEILREAEFRARIRRGGEFDGKKNRAKQKQKRKHASS